EVLDRRLLEPVDLLENIRQRCGISRAEVAAAGRPGDFAEQRLIDLYRHRFVAKAEWPLPRRHRGLALRSDADRVDLDAECRGRLCRGARIHGALVVLAVGEEHDDFALARRATEAVG